MPNINFTKSWSLKDISESQNPCQSSFNMSSPQHSAMIKCTSNLIAAFKSNLIVISAGLFSENLISSSMFDETNNISLPMDHRACSLVRAIIAEVEKNTENYQKLREVLSKNPELHKGILDELQMEFESLQIGEL